MTDLGVETGATTARRTEVIRVASNTYGATLARRLAVEDYNAQRSGSTPPRFDDDDGPSEPEQTDTPWADEDGEAGDEALDPLDLVGPARPRTNIRVWVDPQNFASVVVPAPSLVALSKSAQTSSLTARWVRLQAYGRAIASTAGPGPSALGAQGLLALYDAIGSREAEDFAESAGVDPGELSREAREIVVELPAGRVALDFFFLQAARGRSPEGLSVHEIVARTLGQHDLLALSIPKIKERVPGAGPSLDKIVPWCRAAARWGELVGATATQWQADPRDASHRVDRLAASIIERHQQSSPLQRREIGTLDARRAAPVLWRALVSAAGDQA